MKCLQQKINFYLIGYQPNKIKINHQASLDLIQVLVSHSQMNKTFILKNKMLTN